MSVEKTPVDDQGLAAEVEGSDEPGPVEFTRKVVEGMADELHARLAMANLVGHPGESGRARENLVREFLRSLLPKGFSMGTGFVIDALGSISRQQDIVIYRDSYHPVFAVGGIQHFPLESVAAVIEVKANLASRAVLISALDNGASVKCLDRSGGGRNYAVSGTLRGEQIEPDKHEHQVYSAIVAWDSISVDSVKEELTRWLPVHSRREWLNQLVVIQHFSTAYLPSAPRTDQMRASSLAFARAESHESRNTRPILDLAQQLMSFLRVCPIVDYQPSSYLPGSYHVDDRVITLGSGIDVKDHQH